MSDRNKLKGKDILTAHAAALVRLLTVNSSPGGREALARALNMGVDAPDRNVAVECGYPATLGIYQFKQIYERHGLAARANDALPNECWRIKPSIYETEKDRTTAFEKGMKALMRRVPLWSILHRLDRLCGIGRYGCLVLGFDDIQSGRKADDPVAEDRDNTLLYAQAYTEDLCEIVRLDETESSPRYGLPVMYRVTVGETRAPGGSVLSSGRSVNVHWTRVVHVADNVDSSIIYGRERLRNVYDYLLDIRKVLGGSAEMFWKGAFPGFSLEMLPEYIGNPSDDELIRKEMEAYHNHLQRYIALEGFKVNPIQPQVADPTPQVTQLINAICATIEFPVRVFMGSESGHLASTQDTGNLNGRVMARREDFVEPFIIRPVVDRLIRFRAVPRPRAADGDYILSWPDLNTVSEKDKADIALKAAQTLMQYVTSGAEKVYPFRYFMIHYLRRTEAEADAVVAEIRSKPELYTRELWEQTEGPQGGGRNGPARGGRPAANEASTSA